MWPAAEQGLTSALPPAEEQGPTFAAAAAGRGAAAATTDVATDVATEAVVVDPRGDGGCTRPNSGKPDRDSPRIKPTAGGGNDASGMAPKENSPWTLSCKNGREE